jgi:hypothetical protein
MQGVCRECHNQNFIDEFYADADVGTEAINEMVLQGRAITDSLKGAGLLTSQPFDQSYDFVDFELWHHWGRTAKFGMWMQGADYTQWHGVYEMLSDLAELREMSTQIFEEAGIAPPETTVEAPIATVEPTAEATSEARS